MLMADDKRRAIGALAISFPLHQQPYVWPDGPPTAASPEEPPT